MSGLNVKLNVPEHLNFIVIRLNKIKPLFEKIVRFDSGTGIIFS